MLSRMAVLSSSSGAFAAKEGTAVGLAKRMNVKAAISFMMASSREEDRELARMTVDPGYRGGVMMVENKEEQRSPARRPRKAERNIREFVLASNSRSFLRIARDSSIPCGNESIYFVWGKELNKASTKKATIFVYVFTCTHPESNN